MSAVCFLYNVCPLPKFAVGDVVLPAVCLMTDRPMVIADRWLEGDGFAARWAYRVHEKPGVIYEEYQLWAPRRSKRIVDGGVL